MRKFRVTGAANRHGTNSRPPASPTHLNPAAIFRPRVCVCASASARLRLCVCASASASYVCACARAAAAWVAPPLPPVLRPRFALSVLTPAPFSSCRISRRQGGVGGAGGVGTVSSLPLLRLPLARCPSRFPRL